MKSHCFAFQAGFIGTLFNKLDVFLEHGFSPSSSPEADFQSFNCVNYNNLRVDFGDRTRPASKGKRLETS